jgi:glycosyltransferase involved in cell wall biosynthesis
MPKDKKVLFPKAISSDTTHLSIVVPTYNEEEGLAIFHERLSDVLNSVPINAEILYVNDGSTDNTENVIRRLRKEDHRVASIDLSRNFGKEIALTAGLDHANGDAVVVIDADLQDPPELIPELIKHWQDGYDVVSARRIRRGGETFVKKITAYVFYRIIHKFSSVSIPEDTGDFRLLSRNAVNSLKGLRERHRFMKGLFAWIGYSQKEITYYREPRCVGETKWSYLKLWNLALEGLTSFSIAPLKLASYFGLLTAFGALVYAAFVVYKTLVYGDPVKGYPSLMVVILFLGGVQLITIGVIGEYLGRIFNETKQRPLYILKNYEPAKNCQTNKPISRKLAADGASKPQFD